MSTKHKRSATVMVETLKKNAGVFIKMGQLLASLEIVIPDEYTTIMSQMYQEAPTSSWESVKETLESSYGTKIEDVFQSLEKEPVNSASIAQVHIGYLKNGEKVAVKVQHNWLKEEVSIDIRMTELFVSIAGYLFEGFKYDWLILDMKNNLPKELNFEMEADNAIKTQELFADNPRIKIPKIFREFSTVRIASFRIKY